ncbi:putative damage-inducible protein DinB [Metabacillus malikii]|uniref:Damage-inducible protein DinB n=1 Tax=Metabacillus malikii TaxID=1504265 RepID=A0ABT9ZA67_9BACI|nr:putative damage-inducible protein DinB [Metabacillus malikii]
MVYDLKGETNMSPIVGMLYSAVKENAERLQSITVGVSQEEIDYKGPGHDFNSTAQLVRHIMYVDLNWVYRIKGQHLPASLIEQYGPMIDANNKLPMNREVDKYSDV